jgi:methylenetetrahydrofolate reductase (NADPH)
MNSVFIELLTPKQSSADLDKSLASFAYRYQAVLAAGHTISIPDNPMGNIHFQATEMISELGLPVAGENLLIHVNTFHSKEDLDTILQTAIKLEARNLLLVSGDGGERLSRITPGAIGLPGNVATSVELLTYIGSEYPGVFHPGVAFNPYEPQDHEMEKLRKKSDAGAGFVITQPILGRDERLDALLRQTRLPVTLGCWMSPRIHLLSECVGYSIPEDTPYDPMENLKLLRRTYPGCGSYLALVGFRTQLPIIDGVLAA